MTWNWEHKGWPDFIYDPERFEDYERQFLHKAGAIHGSMKHISAVEQETLKVELIVTRPIRLLKSRVQS